MTLGLLSYVVLGVIRRSRSPLMEVSLGTQTVVTVLLLILLASLGGGTRRDELDPQGSENLMGY